MCGIVGFIDFNKKSNFNILKNMTDVLHHRGPDDSGYSFYTNEYAHIGLGHRRLSILDLSAHGHQPMSFQNLEIIYNGEIYNFKEIGAELEKYGYSFESNSDTEVILKAYHKWGIKAVDKFNGMFAIAIYDKKDEKIILIRDRAGVKPLYYYYKNGYFLFSSELKSFHEHPMFKKEINTDALALFFQYGYILEPYSIFENTYKFPAGHYGELNIKNKEFKIYKYWDIIDYYNKPKLNISFEEAKEKVKELLESAFEYRMVSDVPVGVFLSGGYDSSAVTAILQKDRSEKLKTFSIGFHEKKYNEANYAKKIAEYLGTDHTEYYCTQKDAQELLPLLCEIWDEPFGDSSNIPTTLVSYLARKEVKVSLSADGGDEVFGGYDKYTQTLKYRKLFSKVPFSKTFASIMETVNPNYLIGINKTYNFVNRYEKLKTLIKAKDEIEMMNGIVYYFQPSEVDKLLGKTLKINTSFDYAMMLNLYNNSIDKLMAIDYKTYLPDDILVKVDRATMSVSLEGREPLLDHRVIEFVSQLPSAYKVKDGNKKCILKSIVHDYIPKKLMDRPKMGFSIPLNEWLGDELRKYVLEYLNSEKVVKTEVLNPSEVERLKKQYLKNSNFSTNKIWLLLVFMMWYERWMK
jgi:asparagine synthase (glutamine-hydrolysing)